MCQETQSDFPFPTVRAAEAVPTGEGCSGLGASPPRDGFGAPPGKGAAGQGSGSWRRRGSNQAKPGQRFRPLGPGPLTWPGLTAGPKMRAAFAAVAGFRAAGRNVSPSIQAKCFAGPGCRGLEGAEVALHWRVSGPASAGGAPTGSPSGGTAAPELQLRALGNRAEEFRSFTRPLEVGSAGSH